MSKFTDYIKDTKGEMKHVSWPSKKQAILFTAIVIIFSLVMAIFLGAFDLGFARLLQRFI
jgi:preprotein translocase subunit SecE